MDYTIKHLTTLEMATLVESDAETLWAQKERGEPADDAWRKVNGSPVIPKLEGLRYAGTDRELFYATEGTYLRHECQRHRIYSIALSTCGDILAIICHSRKWLSTDYIEWALDNYTNRDTSDSRTTTLMTCLEGYEKVAAVLLAEVCRVYGAVTSTNISKYEAPIIDALHHNKDVSVLHPPYFAEPFWLDPKTTRTYPVRWGAVPEYAFGRINQLPVSKGVYCIHCRGYKYPEDAPDFNLNGW